MSARSHSHSGIGQRMTSSSENKVVPPEQPYGSLEALLEAEVGCGEQQANRQLVAQSTVQGERTDLCNLHKLTSSARAQQNGVSRRTQVKLDYLAGHNTDL